MKSLLKKEEHEAGVRPHICPEGHGKPYSEMDTKYCNAHHLIPEVAGQFDMTHVTLAVIEEEDMVHQRTSDLCLMLRTDNKYALVDSACPRTVAGQAWMETFLNKYPEKYRPGLAPSKRSFMFGGGEKRMSRGTVIIPCFLDNKIQVSIQVEVVQADLPLLLGNSTLVKGMAVLHFTKEVLEILNIELELHKTRSGHFSVQIDPVMDLPKPLDREHITCLAMNVLKTLAVRRFGSCTNTGATAGWRSWQRSLEMQAS